MHFPSAHTRIKICGVTTPEEALCVVDAGADALGMIFADSPRRIPIERAREIARIVPAFVSLVAVFVDPEPALVEEAVRIGCVPQFCGDESAAFCEDAAPAAYLKAFPVDERETTEGISNYAARYARATLLFDAYVVGMRGGTGKTFDWEIVRLLAARRRVVVSGGLTPDNVGDCVRRVRPYAVDVRSGVETHGKKDPERIAAFVRAVRESDAQT
jgi:phosphoribosylanthranilate isomerase